jgi:hypothetical protein
MWCVAELNDEYIAKMEDVLETYEKTYDPAEPVVCLDERNRSRCMPMSGPPPQPCRDGKRDGITSTNAAVRPTFSVR